MRSEQVGPVLRVRVEVRLQVVELGQHELVVGVAPGRVQVQPDQLERGAYLGQLACSSGSSSRVCEELALRAPPHRVVVEVAHHPHDPAGLGHLDLAGQFGGRGPLGPAAPARTCRTEPGWAGAAISTPTSAIRSSPGCRPVSTSGSGVLTPAPSTRTVTEDCWPAAGPSLANRTRTTWSGRAAVPPKELCRGQAADPHVHMLARAGAQPPPRPAATCASAGPARRKVIQSSRLTAPNAR